MAIQWAIITPTQSFFGEVTAEGETVKELPEWQAGQIKVADITRIPIVDVSEVELFQKVDAAELIQKVRSVAFDHGLVGQPGLVHLDSFAALAKGLGGEVRGFTDLSTEWSRMGLTYEVATSSETMERLISKGELAQEAGIPDKPLLAPDEVFAFSEEMPNCQIYWDRYVFAQNNFDRATAEVVRQTLEPALKVAKLKAQHFEGRPLEVDRWIVGVARERFRILLTQEYLAFKPDQSGEQSFVNQMLADKSNQRMVAANRFMFDGKIPDPTKDSDMEP